MGIDILRKVRGPQKLTRKKKNEHEKRPFYLQGDPEKILEELRDRKEKCRVCLERRVCPLMSVKREKGRIHPKKRNINPLLLGKK